MNVITIIGRLTKDPEVRTTGTGKAVTNFTLAVDKKFKAEGSKADFFRCVAWGSSGEYAAKYLSKGKRAAVSGRHESRQYTDNSGKEVTTWELQVDTVNSLDKTATSEQSSQASSGNQSDTEFDPFAEE